MSTNLTLKYDGNNSVDAIDLSASLLNFAKLLQKTSKDYLDDKQALKVDICAFEKGSLDANTIISVRDSVKETTILVAPILTNIIATAVDTIELGKFLMGGKPQKVSPSKDEPGKVNITNQKGDIGTYTKKAFLNIGDTTINYHIHQYISPIKNDDRLTGQSIISDGGETLTSITKSEAVYFDEKEEYTSQEVNLIGKIYDMNTETMNGKIDVSGSKISISFKKIYEKIDFGHLVKSLKYKAVVKITGEAIVDIRSSVYKNIDITSAILIQDGLFEEDE